MDLPLKKILAGHELGGMGVSDHHGRVMVLAMLMEHSDLAPTCACRLGGGRASQRKCCLPALQKGA